MHRLIGSLILAITLVVGGCAHVAIPNTDQLSADAAALEAALPVLDALRVTNWRNQDWCRTLADSRGVYSTNNAESACNLFAAEGAPFDQAAEGDFNRVREAFMTAKVRVRILITNGRRLEFDLEAGLGDEWSYVRDPGYRLAAVSDCKCIVIPIDDTWYFMNGH